MLQLIMGYSLRLIERFTPGRGLRPQRHNDSEVVQVDLSCPSPVLRMRLLFGRYTLQFDQHRRVREVW